MVVGDLVKITGGLKISVDGFVIKANQLTTDEAAMTGETDPIKKGTMETADKVRRNLDTDEVINAHKIPSPILLSGTKIMTGSGLMIVICVGKYSCSGKIKAKLQGDGDEDDKTPL
jgi:magnesium-transporting ATPase (P-type)